MKKWRCLLCGFEYEGEFLPDDYICPVCGADATNFEEITD